MQKINSKKHGNSRFFVLIVKILRKTKHYIVLFLKKIKKVILIIYEKTYIKTLIQRKDLKNILFDSYYYNNNSQPDDVITVALIIRNGLTHPTSSAFIRLISPLSRLHINKKITFKIYKQNTLKLSNKLGVCIVQRTAFDSKKIAMSFVDNLRKQNIKLIVDNDDAFSAIDEFHSEYSIQKSRIEALEYIIQKADQVWASTEELARLHKNINKNTYIVSNTLDKNIWTHKIKHLKEQSPLRLIYMGTATHDEDFKMIYSHLEKLHKKYPNKFVLYVIGVSARAIPNKKWIKRLYQPAGRAIYPRFVSWFIKQGPFDIGLCPLVESDFNKYKSDIKCLDYFGIGAMPFASNTPAYKTDGLDKFIQLVNNNGNNWFEALEKAVSKPQDFRRKKIKIVRKASNYLWSQRSVEQSSTQIKKLLEELLSK